MKKFALASLMLVTLAGASFAQTAPKKTKTTKMETKTTDSSSTGAAHHHMHKGTKHAKAK